MNKNILFITIFSITIILSGCVYHSSPNITTTCVASKKINLNSSGRASPTVVKVLELRDKKQFLEAPYHNFLKNDYNFLGKDLQKSYEYILRPNTSITKDVKLSAETKYIGYIALFTRSDNINWKNIIVIPNQSSYDIRINLDNDGFKIKHNPKKKDKSYLLSVLFGLGVISIVFLL